MYLKDTVFYTWVVEEFIHETLLLHGTKFIKLYYYLKQYFPEAIKALNKMYYNFKLNDLSKAKPLKVCKPNFIYEHISNLIPSNQNFKFDLYINEFSDTYKHLNCKASGSIERIDLILLILLFSEEFIFKPAKINNLNITPSELTTEGTYVSINIRHNINTTSINIQIKDALSIQFIILN
ncbi:MAG: hypothetical protein E7311_04325 [Clostridiales bacterium]|nr:hypothetical protein [Clostridiales bacterium]